MPKPVIINIIVDTKKLLEQYPTGGDIEVHDIIEMNDEQSESYFKDGLKDKLVTVVDPNASLTWVIDSLTKSEKLVFVKCEPSSKFKSMCELGPEPVEEKYCNKWKAKLKKNLAKSEKGYYCFEFAIKDKENITWKWDPDVQIKPPKP